MRHHAVLLGTLVLLVSCGGGSTSPAGTIVIAGLEANDRGTEDVTGTGQAGLELDEYSFSPTVLSGTAGQALTLRLGNAGEVDHTFTSEPLGVDVVVPAGGEATAEVTFPDSGAILFECRFHAGQGMRGGLSVDGSLDAAGGGFAPGDVDDTGDSGGGYGGYG